MKICQIITTLELGGAETLLVNFCNIHCQNHEVHVIYLKGEPKVKALFKDQITITKIPLGLSCAKKVRKYLKTFNPDVIHTHLGHADWIGLWASRGLKSKIFCTMHNIFFKWDWRDQLIFALYRVYFGVISKESKVVCISKVVEKHVQSVLGVPQKRTKLLYNGIPRLENPLKQSEAQLKLGIAQDKFVILFVGRLEKQKAVHVLLQAVPIIAEIIPNLHVDIVGEGTLRQELINLAEELNITTYVNFRGNSHQVPDYFAAADVFVLPSIFEGLGIVILEAFRAGVPVVASNLEGPAELIRHNENGLLFEPTNFRSLADSVLLLHQDKRLFQSIRATSKASFDGRFSISTYANDLEYLYQS